MDSARDLVLEPSLGEKAPVLGEWSPVRSFPPGGRNQENRLAKGMWCHEQPTSVSSESTIFPCIGGLFFFPFELKSTSKKNDSFLFQLIGGLISPPPLPVFDVLFENGSKKLAAGAGPSRRLHRPA